jgi:predicted ArsR family transcriptional regulator
MAERTRQRIIEHLQRQGQASVAELSGELDLTSVTIRHHLEILRQEGLVGEPQARRRKGPGRPEMGYALTRRALPHLPRNFPEFCLRLAEEMDSSLPSAELEGLFAAAGRRAAVQFKAHHPAGSAGRRRQIQAWLEARGYFPRWQARPQGWRLELANCPYLESAQSVPHFCSYDAALMAGLAGEAVQIQARIVDRQPVCALLIGSASN